jgi:tRNA G18 (ribose-2'-O)-methylase SpoU
MKRVILGHPAFELFPADDEIGRLAENTALVVGNEGNGADPIFLKETETVAVPMAGRTESLNAGMAAGILMYESMRQRAQGRAGER